MIFTNCAKRDGFGGTWVLKVTENCMPAAIEFRGNKFIYTQDCKLPAWRCAWEAGNSTIIEGCRNSVATGVFFVSGNSMEFVFSNGTATVSDFVRSENGLKFIGKNRGLSGVYILSLPLSKGVLN